MTQPGDAPLVLEMPQSIVDGFRRFQSHKIVRASKIVDIEEDHVNAEYPVVITFEDENLPKFAITLSWWHQKKASPGGYFVIYDDGYYSYSPAEAFEAGYTELT